MNYKSNIVDLVSYQVDEFIKKVLRPDVSDIENSTHTGWDRGYQTRRDVLLAKDPKPVTSAVKDASTILVAPLNSGTDGVTSTDSSRTSNNNPLYPDNMFNRLNTVFDHIDRIIVQDFAQSEYGTSQSTGIEDFFKELFTFSFNDGQNDRFGVNGITVNYRDYDNVFGDGVNPFASGEYFVDSFTYTPFIDYSQVDGENGDSDVGIYSDEHLTKYNQGWYNISDNQVDVNRRDISSNLYRLGNLQKDIDDIRISYRDALHFATVDKEGHPIDKGYQVYIHTFCDHLMRLFAKLSNVRMSHEFYGFKTPHKQYEGILALDIWYQLLYMNIDAPYVTSQMFNEEYLDRNPMVKLPVHNGVVTYLGQDIDVSNPNVFTEGVEDGFALYWDENLWNEFNTSAHNINDRRNEYVLPRGVLEKIYDIVNNPPDKETICADGFKWFYQKGKVYSDSSKSMFTKYTNLHLGRAYDVMSPKEFYSDIAKKCYGEETASTYYVNNLYTKPAVTNVTDKQLVFEQMLNRGLLALNDAFSVICNQKLFNIFNSKTSKIEEFDPQNAGAYSQAQCAIVIERVFSRLYKYIHFKSTTGETFQKHINIDSGYKYHTTESLLKSDNPTSDVYYDDRNVSSTTPPYLSYLTKLLEYLDDSSSVLDIHEKAVIKNAIQVLGRKFPNFVDEWNVCPLCHKEEGDEDSINALQSPRMLSRFLSRSGSSSNMKTLCVVFNLDGYMSVGDVPQVSDADISTYGENNKPFAAVHRSDGEVNFGLSRLALSPVYTYKGNTVHYSLAGYTTQPNSNEIDFQADSVITDADFNGQDSLTLYAVWKLNEYIIEFRNMDNGSDNSMNSIVVPTDISVTLPRCEYTSTNMEYMFTYHRSPSGKWVWKYDEESDVEQTDRINVQAFDKWTYTSQGVVKEINDCGIIRIPSVNGRMHPIVTLTARWKSIYDKVNFNIGDELYCEVLISRRDDTLVYPPDDPELVQTESSKVRFTGWEYVQGTTMGGISINQSVICGTTEEDIICDVNSDDIVCDSGCSDLVCGDTDFTGDLVCSSADGQLVCQSPYVQTYDTVIYAMSGDERRGILKVTFKYLKENDNGEVEFASAQANVAENQIIPNFHIHDIVGDYAFRYWRLESGNLTSSRTILSDCVFVAVYDEIGEQVESSESEIVYPQEIFESKLHYDSTESELHCPYLSEGLNKDDEHYCTYTGQDNQYFAATDTANYPHYRIKGDDGVIVNQYDEDILRINCPKLNLLNRPYHEDDDFEINSVLEIQDIANLIKGLFKVNIDIAHREYFLKFDIPNDSDWWYGHKDYDKWISFEPTVEFKFCNLHAANQIGDNGRLICTVNEENEHKWTITPVNRELIEDTEGIHYADSNYYYDYITSLDSVNQVGLDSTLSTLARELNDSQKYYDIEPLHLYEHSAIQSPVDVNGFVRHRLDVIERTNRQVQTFTSIVKKYRPVIVPNVRDIFNDCINNSTKYQVDVDNDYGVFGWCTIPSKTMVNMEYNEQSIIVPSSYDHHNRVGGSNFLQIDPDFENIYKEWDDTNKILVSNIKDSWYYLYNERDWTYFLLPFFNVKQNNELYSYMLDSIPEDWGASRPTTSNHLNGVIFEASNLGRAVDTTFGDIANTCRFLAKYHHNYNNLNTLATRYTNLIPMSKLKELTSIGEDYNAVYGSCYNDIIDNIVFWDGDIIDDYDKTGSYVNYMESKPNDEIIYDDDSHVDDVVCDDWNDIVVCDPDYSRCLKYKYNLGHRHAIDDYDEDSVWFYITMVSPIEDLNQVIELEDIMPFVFWWSNRGRENNGPTVNCYGRQSNAKLNYERGGYCYESSVEKSVVDDWVSDAAAKERNEVLNPDESVPEQKWHAVQHTLGCDFSDEMFGGVLVTQDNSGNCYQGAFDPNCTCSEEKWKIHHGSNAFGTDQNADPMADKYNLGYQTHGEASAPSAIPEQWNDRVIGSMDGKPMTWNLWNVIRHYVFIKYFKNRNRQLGNDLAAWQELENYTKKIVRGIYRSFKQNQPTKTRVTFADVDELSNNEGEECSVYWTNSFIQISSLFNRNAREHEASFVLFTGNDSDFDIDGSPDAAPVSTQKYNWVRNHIDNFRITTLDGVDEDEDGMRPRKPVMDSNDVRIGWEQEEEYEDKSRFNVFNGVKYGELPSQYIIGDSIVYNQRTPDVTKRVNPMAELDLEYPECEYYLDDRTRKWVAYISNAVMNQQILPVYTSMEGMTKSHHDLTVDDMKSITFQVIPQFYWKYQWSFNEYMIHRVGKLNAPVNDIGIEMYDMLGNVWEWVRDDWCDDPYSIMSQQVINPIIGDDNTGWTAKKVIKGGAFDQFCRKTISPAREGLDNDKCRSKYGTQANVGFRPALEFTAERERGQFNPGEDPIDLFFLFDASASQNNTITEMLNAAKRIVQYFSGKVDNQIINAAKEQGSTDEQRAAAAKEEEKKNLCHVGSALFLGSTIKFMCSKEYLSKKPLYRRQYELNQSRMINDEKTAKLYWTPEYNDPEKAQSPYTDADGKAINQPLPEDGGTSFNDVKKSLKKKYLNFREQWQDIQQEHLDDSVEAIGSRNIDAAYTSNEDDFNDLDSDIVDDIDIQIETGFDLNEQIETQTRKTLAKPMKMMASAPAQDAPMVSRDGTGSGSSGGSSSSYTVSPSGGGGGGGGSSGPWKLPIAKYFYYKYDWVLNKDIYIHSGVPAWSSILGTGTDGKQTYSEPNFGKYSGGNVQGIDLPSYMTSDTSPASSLLDEHPFSGTFKFFSYNPTKEGINEFEFPFVNSTSAPHRGCLSNWYAGCEPVSDMVSKLLKDGCFWSWPWNYGLGYMFRGKKVPKLVIVFSNEYDNTMIRGYSNSGSSEKEVFVYPLINNGSVVMNTHLQKVKNINSDLSISDQNAPDPYCLQNLRQGEDVNGNQVNYLDKIQQFLISIGLCSKGSNNRYTYIDNNQDSGGSLLKESIDAIRRIRDDAGSSGRSKYNCGFNKLNNLIYSFGNNNIYTTYTSNSEIPYTGLSGPGNDLNYTKNYIGSVDASQVLSYEMYTQLKKQRSNRENYIPGYRLGGRDSNKVSVTGIQYDALQTMGYYQLLNQFKCDQNIVNTYMFVSDANSPTPLYQPDAQWDENDENKLVDAAGESIADNKKDAEIKNIAHSIFLYNDLRMMVDIQNIALPNVLQTVLQSKMPPSITLNEKYGYTNGKWTWKTLLLTNALYQKNSWPNGVSSNGIGMEIQTIFGLENPYTKTNIVWGFRHNATTLSTFGGKNVTDGIYYVCLPYNYNDDPVVSKLGLDLSNKDDMSIYLNARITYALESLAQRMNEYWRELYQTYILDSNSATPLDDVRGLDNEKYEKAYYDYLFDELKSRTDYPVRGEDESDTDYYNSQKQFVDRNASDGNKSAARDKGVQAVFDSMTIAWAAQQRTWFDEHICPKASWSDKDRIAKGLPSKYNLDENTCQVFGVKMNFTHYYNSIKQSNGVWKDDNDYGTWDPTNYKFFPKKITFSNFNYMNLIQKDDQSVQIEDSTKTYTATRYYIGGMDFAQGQDRSKAQVVMFSAKTNTVNANSNIFGKLKKLKVYNTTDDVESLPYYKLVFRDNVKINDNKVAGSDTEFKTPVVLLVSDIKDFRLSILYSAESFNVSYGMETTRSQVGNTVYVSNHVKSDYDISRSDNFVLTATPTDYVTVSYHASGVPDADVTGTMKIISIPVKPAKFNASGIVYGRSHNVDVALPANKQLLNDIMATTTTKYPMSWKQAVQDVSAKIINSVRDDEGNIIVSSIVSGSGSPPRTIDDLQCNEIWEDEDVQRFVLRFYRDIKSALPTLLAYRYYNDMFSKMTNAAGKSVVDYYDFENTFVVKPVPIMNPEKLDAMFQLSFGNGNMNSGSHFSYTHCIVDLNPQIDSSDDTQYIGYPGLTTTEGLFPMKFASNINVNSGDTYKTDKLVLTRVPTISTKMYSGFSIGSHTEDYDKITDELLKKYSDPEAVLDASSDRNANIILTNDGAYRKNVNGINSFYNIEWTNANNVQEMKYRKNKHLFIDPFALTIAQWCYVHGWNTMSGARNNLGSDKLIEMQKSYWKYIYIWEKPEWAELRSKMSAPSYSPDDKYMYDEFVAQSHADTRNGFNVKVAGMLDSQGNVKDESITKVDEMLLKYMVDNNMYNPLTDTRPYYYASYNEVRGTPQVYQPLPSVATANGGTGERYIMSNDGDEYQMVSRIEPVITGAEEGTEDLVYGEPHSFMDILNSKVAYQTRRRIYQDEPDGGRWMNEPKMDGRDSTYRDYMRCWCRGERAGINFDLPTEAQWEYCCRVPKSPSLTDDDNFNNDEVPYEVTPAYPDRNLGMKFEERISEEGKDAGLDLIAWYKYKVIGTLPEPERYCAWRISKMMFGICKDKEQVNNVYELKDD